MRLEEGKIKIKYALYTYTVLDTKKLTKCHFFSYKQEKLKLKFKWFDLVVKN